MKLILKLFKWWYMYKVVGVVNPLTLKVTYYPENIPVPKDLEIHDQCHIDQIKREGKFMFILHYTINTFKYGYFNNPYEIEARNKAGQ